MARTLKSCLGVIGFVALLLFSDCGTAEANKAHPDACNACHRMAGANPRAVNSLCLGCHVSSGSADAQAAGVFSPAAASNAFNHNASAGTGAGSQTSHFWGGSKTAFPPAGSQNPPTSFYSSRNAISTGLVTCSICHDPHSSMTTSAKLLRSTTSPTTDVNDAVCKQCHLPFYQDNASALLTHPVGTSARPSADPLKFNPSVVNIGKGTVQLVNGYVTCSSCHSTHFADSDSTTTDGNQLALNPGDGKLLRTDGKLAVGANPQETADRRSAACTACHPYKTHGNSTEPVGCLVCHSAHVYNASGPPNYFVLRNNATTTTYGAVTGLNYRTLGTAQTIWADGNTGTAAGYCEKCHGNLPTMPRSIRTHVEGENCRTCHAHNTPGAMHSFDSFDGIGCDGCHGYPPATNVPVTGYAVSPNHNYSLDPNFKNEATAPHSIHSGSTSSYKFLCVICHNTDRVITHDKGTFQDVFTGATFAGAVRPAGSGLTPTYVKSGNGTCSSIACHSNGGKRTGDGAKTYKLTAPAWGNALGSITTCNACHGNDVTSMAGAQRDNSTSHIKHLNQGYSCAMCHADTAASATALVPGAENVKHVNGTIEVKFSGFAAGGTYNATTGTCAVSCHDGSHDNSPPDWDIASSAACGTCHQYSAGGVATGSGSSLSPPHGKHVYTSDGGVQLSCNTCHTNNGSGPDHVNGVASLVANYQATVCNTCHGATNGASTGDDRQPNWTYHASVDCQTCHAGSVVATINSKVAANKSTALSSGHNKTGNNYAVSGNGAANKVCSSCHDSNAVGHLDGTSGDDMLLIAAAATCTTSCHGPGGSAVKDGINTHQAKDCSVCHDPHGTSNIYMINSTSTGNFSGTVVFNALTGANSYDEVDAGNSDDLCATCHTYPTTTHNNKTNEGVAHNEGTDCFTCHKSHSDATPFVAGSGNACNDCHGFPPATAAHAKHSQSASNDKNNEDLSDCAMCHTGAASYTYSPGVDQGLSRNHGNAIGRVTLLTASVGYNSTNKNCATACHNSTLADGAWNDANGLNCNSCHYYAATPTSAGNITAINSQALAGDHSQHFGAGGSFTCATCHGTDPVNTTHITTGTGLTDAEKYADRAAAVADEAAVVVPTWDDDNNGCSNAACHNPEGQDNFIATWNVSTVSCILCHGSMTTRPVSGSHPAHLNAATLFGIDTITCNTCHSNNGTNNRHQNGTVNVLAGLTYTPAAVDVGGVVGTCTTTTCHNNGLATPVAVVTPNWGVVSADCTICHANPPATGAHGAHVNATYIDGSCTDCHTAANTLTHINGSRNMASQVSVYTPASGTCTNSCHTVVDGRDWTSATDLVCTDCHGSGKVTTPALDRGWPPSSGAHAAHLGNTIYVTGTNCVDCHNNNTTTHSTLNNIVTSATGTKISVNPGNGSCTNSCHAAAQASDWTGGSATIGCVDCHSGTYIAGNNVARGFNATPVSGLHAVTPSVSGQRHDQSVAGGCASCHNTLSALASHMNGTFTGDAMVNLGLRYYTQTAANVGTCLTTGCHTGRDDWTHKWMATANYASATLSCSGCHGDWANGWNDGIVHRTSVDTKTKHGTGTTYACRDCHNLEAASGYVFTFGGNDWGGTSTHGDNFIQVNSNNTNYAQASGLCTSCHTTVDGIHNFLDTGRTISAQSGNAISSNCGECHSGGVTPISASGAHTAHNAGIGALVDGGAACIACHGDNGGAGYLNTLAGTHGNSSVTFANVGYSTATRNDLAGTCFTANCHNANTGTDQSTTWNSTQLACDDCHYYATTTTATVAGNSAHGRPLSSDHGTHFATGGTFACADCHGTDPVAGDTTHINGATTLADKAVAVPFEAAISAAAKGTGNDQLTAGTATTCNNVACHNPSATTYSANWQVSTSSCTLCHSVTDPTTTSHTAHMSATATFGQTITCTSCHPDHAANNRHSNGTRDVQVAKNGSVQPITSPTALNGCGTNDCHNNGVNLTNGTPGAYTWGTPAGDCTLCHGDATTLTSNAHNEHMNNGYSDAECTDCHTDASDATHINKSINFDSTMATYSRTDSVAIGGTPNGTCFTSSCHNITGSQSIAWNVPAGTDAGTTDLTCNSCHYWAAVPSAAGNNAHFDPLSTSHSEHFTAGKGCALCHGTAPTTTAHISSKSNLVDGAVALQDEASMNWTVATTDYTLAPDNTCGSVTNNGLGCHASGTPDWDVPFASTACINCHSNFSNSAVNPTSGLHGVVPSVSGVQHDNSFGVAGTCSTCHPTLPAAGGTHMNATFTGDGSVAGDRTAMGLAPFYANSGSNNVGTCGTTSCHFGNSDDWAHKWMATANYTSNTLSCSGCHGDWTNTWNSGIIHRTSVATQSKHGTGATYDCKDCHNLEAASGYTFTFNSNDWGGASTHGDGQIQVNNNGTGPYNPTSGLCTICHGSSNGIHNFVDSSWPIAAAPGDVITSNCGECHSGGVTPGSASGAHTLHNAGTGALVAGGAACVSCHGNNGGLGYQNALAGTHGIGGTVNFANVTYSTATRNDLAGTCMTANCHNVNTGTDQSTAWNSTQLACDDCHYHAAANTATTTGNSAHARPLSSDHGTHFGAGGIFACSDCHGTDPVAGDTAHINGVTTLADKAVAVPFEATISATAKGSGTDQLTAGTATTCNNVACHNPSATTYSANWQVSTSSCTLCHSATDPTTDSHTEHTGATAIFGLSITCASCHPDHGVNNRHFDGIKNVQVAKNGSTQPIASPTDLNGCGTNDCHNNGVNLTSGTPGAYTWGTAAGDCTVCHGDATALSSNAHNEHMNAGYSGANCTDCHTAATAATHINKSINLDNAKVTYSRTATVAIGGTPSGTCFTASCHNRSGSQSIAWNVPAGTVAGTTDLTCNSCHYWAASPTVAGNTAHFDPLSVSHGDHFTASKGCNLCHGADPTTTAHITGKTSLVDGSVALQDEASMNWAVSATDYTLAPDNTCGSVTNNGLGCHASGTPDWDVPFASTACINCHSNYSNSAVNPTSGLHGVIPSVTGVQHDNSFGVAGTCSTCHPTLPAAGGTHMNATFTGDGSVAGDRTAMGLATFYTNSGSNNIGTCGTTSCHLGNSDDWAHKWMATASYTSSTLSCTGCHGTTIASSGLGNANTTHRAVPSKHNGVAINYSCRDCHAIEGAGYTFTFGTTDWGGASNHGNSNIEINSSGTAYNQTTGYCEGCHVSGSYNFTDTGWAVASVAGTPINVACGECHTGGVRLTLVSGAHAMHNANTTELVDGGAACIPCHGNNGGLNFHDALAGSHGIGGVVNFANVSYSTATRNDLTGTCLTANCHNVNTGADRSTTWNSGALACNDCHYYATGTTATAAANTAHSRPLSSDHGTHFGAGGSYACTDCHGADPVDSSHISNIKTLADKAVAVPFEATITPLAMGTGFDQLTAGTATTCNNTSCHNPSSTTYSANWQVSTASCTLCHSATDPTTDSHTAHMGATATFGQTITCTSCHPNYAGNNRHMDGSVTVQVAKNSVTTVVASPTALNGCGTNDCHNNGVNLTTGTPGDYTWGTAAGDCTVCHGDATTLTSNAHNEHMNNGYSGANCTDCHTAASAAAHINKSINIDASKATYSRTASVAIGGTPNGTCFTSSCHNRSGTQSIAWNVATGQVAGTTDLTCNSCHYWAASPTAAGNNAHFDPLSTSHGDHFTASKGCNLCHGTAPTTTAHITAKTSLIDGAVALQDEASMNWGVSTTDYTLAPDNTCGSVTNNGLGCHASGVPDWDVAFASNACINCHSNFTNTAVNPTSGLHGVVPSVSGVQHDNSFGVSGTCSTCHPTLPAAGGTHMNATFTGNGSVAGDRTTMGLATFYTNSGSDNNGTCGTTSCHLGFSDDWAHKWTATTSDYTSPTLSCTGCHGSALASANLGTTGVIHRAVDAQHNTGTTYDCMDCHNLEAGSGYTFTFGSADWANRGETSTHGDSQIQVNSNGTTYNSTSGYCTSCHISGAFNFADTTWTIAAAAGNTISANCASCHAYPPAPGDGKTPQAIESKGVHAKHVTHIAARAGVTLNPDTDTFSVGASAAVCGVCHDVSVGTNHNTSGGTRHLLLKTSRQFGPSAPSFNGTVGVSSSVDPKSCSSLDCHFKETPIWAPVGGE